MSTKVTTVLDFSTSGAGIQSLVDPTNAQDAATKNYVDLTAQGLKPKPSLDLATAAALPSNTYSNGTSGVGATLTATANAALTVDGVAVSVNQRIGVKNEATGANNGFYKVTATGSGAAPYVLTRTTDFDAGAEIPGAFAYVEQGTVNNGTVWVNTNTTAPTLGTTSITFTQLAGPGTITGGTGITVTGNSVALTTPVAIANGGSNATTAATARDSTHLGSATAPSGGTGTSSVAAGGIPVKVTATLGDGATTAFTLTDNIGSILKTAQVSDHTTGAVIIVDITKTANTTVVTFSAAPATNAYDLVVIG